VASTEVAEGRLVGRFQARTRDAAAALAVLCVIACGSSFASSITPAPSSSLPREVRGTEKTWPATLVLLALGFLGPERGGHPRPARGHPRRRGNVETGPDKQTKAKGVFAAGDMRRGQSLVVWAIAEGRPAAEGVDRWLKAGER